MRLVVTFVQMLLGMQLDISGRLAGRRCARPEEFVATLELQERRHAEAGFRPERPLSDLRPGTYYLCEVDGLYRRTYSRKPPSYELPQSGL